ALGPRTGARTGPAAASATAPALEQVGEDVGERAAVEAALAAGRAATAEGVAPAGERVGARVVVVLALVGVTEDVPRRRDLLEPRLGRLVPRVAVRVVLAGELAVRLLDLVVGRLLVDAENAVQILRLGHRYAATTTRAGRMTVPLRR